MNMPINTAIKFGEKGFSAVYEQICNFLAVSSVSEPNETIKGLISLCLIELSDDSFSNAQDFHDTINILFDISIPEHQIQNIVDQMIDEGKLLQHATNVVLDPDYRQTLIDRIKKTEQLEASVKKHWLEEIEKKTKKLPSGEYWKSLKRYLYSVFRRHGLQAAALLDPAIETPDHHEASLSSLLNKAVSENIETKGRNHIKMAVSGFLASAGDHGERSQYITQLADGAFNYYSLVVPPEVVEKIRQQLPDLLLLMDTNFLFGILGLHYNSQVEISHDIIRTVSDKGLPFRLRYHEATQKELINTITGIGYNLRESKWSSSLSRAAIRSGNLTGLELKYHGKNASQPLDVDEFLRPYRHVDPLLKYKGLDIFRPEEDRLQERSDLFHRYKDYLENLGRDDKTDDVIQHDVTILDAVRQRRNRNPAAIEGGALLLTCDYTLYRFDWETSRENGMQACVVLPNTFWQILRPLVPTDPNFEKSFASTFAIPEFRAIGSGSSRACSKMMSILASWEEVPEETALKLLSSEILIEQLKRATDDQGFEKQVKQAFIEENATLLEEKVAIERQLNRERLERKSAAKTYKEEQNKSLAQIGNAIKQAEESKAANEAKEREVGNEEAKRHAAEGKSFKLSVVAGLAVGGLLAATFIFFVHRIPWAWLIQHHNSLSLQVGGAAMFVLGSVGFFVPKWRKYCWGGTGVAGVAFVLLSSLGGGSVEKP